MERRVQIVGNWKMNGTVREARELVHALVAGSAPILPTVDLVVCPPFTSLAAAREALDEGGGKIILGAQDLHPEPKGAFTGGISAPMLVDLGVAVVLVGHSERRTHFGEGGPLLLRKLQAALDAGLSPILCIGESLEQREQGMMGPTLDGQLAETLLHLPPSALERVTLAYEPVWAIGTGRNATPEQAEGAHAHIRHWIDGHIGKSAGTAMRILYGGSVNGPNARGLMGRAGVDGVLVGGASLAASEFLKIAEAAAL